MNTVTIIPKKITKGEELIVIPRVEYEELRAAKTIQEFSPTQIEKRDLARAQKSSKRKIPHNS